MLAKLQYQIYTLYHQHIRHYYVIKVVQKPSFYCDLNLFVLLRGGGFSPLFHMKQRYG
jgi:hypothetical protein